MLRKRAPVPFAPFHQGVTEDADATGAVDLDDNDDAVGAGGGAAAAGAGGGGGAWQQGQVVTTPYGSGRVLEVREDGVVSVRLPYGISYMSTHGHGGAGAIRTGPPDTATARPPVPTQPPPAPGRRSSRSGAATAKRGPRLPFRQEPVVTDCVVQLGLIDALRAMVDTCLPALEEEHVRMVLQALTDSLEFARKFNADRHLRSLLHRAGKSCKQAASVARLFS